MPANEHGVESTALTRRFLLMRFGAVCRGGFYLGSVYLHDSVGVTAACNLNVFPEIAAELSLISGDRILGGDWNCTPDKHASTGWLQRQQLRFLDCWALFQARCAFRAHHWRRVF